jgi:hypothetical protein
MSENNNNNNFNSKKPAANLGNAVVNMTTSGNKNSSRMNKPANSMNKPANSMNKPSNSMNKPSSINETNTNYDEENNEENDEENETKKVSLTGSAATANAIANSATMGTTNSLNSSSSPSINNFSKNKGNKSRNFNKKKSNTKIMNNNSYKNLTLKNTLGEGNTGETAGETAGKTPIEKAEENTLDNLVNNNNKTSGVGVNNKTSQNVGEESTNVESKLEPTNNNKGKNNLEKLASLNRVCMNLINHQVVMKLFHFQTDHYGSHKTSDAYIEKYSNTFDKFLEIAQGIYGKITLKKYSLVGSSHNDENIVKHLEGMITYWRTKMDDILGNYSDLINIRDELVGDAEQMKYLLTFK